MARKYQQRTVMVATKAIHKLGDASREEPDFCLVHGEAGDNYVGNWCTGLGLSKVLFPKATTRKATRPEKRKYKKMKFAIAGFGVP